MIDFLDEFRKFQEDVSKPIDNGRVLIIDGLNTYLRAFAATPTMNEDGNHAGGITGFLLSIGAVIRMFKPARVIVVFDGSGGSQRRRQLFPKYKDSRRSMTKLNRTYDFQSLEEEHESRKWQLKVLVALLRMLPVTVLAPDLVEADDVIAYLAQTVVERGGSAIIMSTDKDFLQLVSPKIFVYNPVKKKMYDPPLVVEDYGFHPNNFLMYRMVTGDNSDCIPGVEGIKEKTLLKYFPQLAEEEPRDIQFMLETAQQLVADKKKPPVALQSLLNSKDQLVMNMKLMRLDDVAMSVSTRLDVLEKFEKHQPELNSYELTKLLVSYKLSHAFGRLEEWIMSTFLPLTRYKLGK